VSTPTGRPLLRPPGRTSVIDDFVFGFSSGLFSLRQLPSCLSLVLLPWAQSSRLLLHLSWHRIPSTSPCQTVRCSSEPPRIVTITVHPPAHSLFRFLCPKSRSWRPQWIMRMHPNEIPLNFCILSLSICALSCLAVCSNIFLSFYFWQGFFFLKHRYRRACKSRSLPPTIAIHITNPVVRAQRYAHYQYLTTTLLCLYGTINHTYPSYARCSPTPDGARALILNFVTRPLRSFRTTSIMIPRRSLDFTIPTLACF